MAREEGQRRGRGRRREGGSRSSSASGRGRRADVVHEVRRVPDVVRDGTNVRLGHSGEACRFVRVSSEDAEGEGVAGRSRFRCGSSRDDGGVQAARGTRAGQEGGEEEKGLVVTTTFGALGGRKRYVGGDLADDSTCYFRVRARYSGVAACMESFELRCCLGYSFVSGASHVTCAQNSLDMPTPNSLL